MHLRLVKEHGYPNCDDVYSHPILKNNLKYGEQQKEKAYSTHYIIVYCEAGFQVLHYIPALIYAYHNIPLENPE